MKIRIDKDVVTFTPEHAAEAAELEALWIKMGNCVGGNKSLQPIGVYQPSPLPPEFRRENEDLNMPRTDDELLERLENLYLFRPFF